MSKDIGDIVQLAEEYAAMMEIVEAMKTRVAQALKGLGQGSRWREMEWLWHDLLTISVRLGPGVPPWLEEAAQRDQAELEAEAGQFEE